MIKLLRKSAIDNPWFFRSIMLIIAVTFIISMGWYGFTGESGPSYVARVGQETISLVEYEQYKENAYRYYQEIFKENFKEDMVRQFVINSMVERQLWLKLARELDISVGIEELEDAVTRNTTFHDSQGRFDPERYRFFLSRSHLMASDFERSVREDLVIDKTRRMIQEGVILTESEIADAKTTVKDIKIPPEKRGAEEDRALQNALALKQQRVLNSALNQLRAETPIEIKNQLL